MPRRLGVRAAGCRRSGAASAGTSAGGRCRPRRRSRRRPAACSDAVVSDRRNIMNSTTPSASAMRWSAPKMTISSSSGDMDGDYPSGSGRQTGFRYHRLPLMAASTDTSTTLDLASRAAEGSRSARRLRRTGQVPGVIYGGERRTRAVRGRRPDPAQHPGAFGRDPRDLASTAARRRRCSSRTSSATRCAARRSTSTSCAST